VECGSAERFHDYSSKVGFSTFIFCNLFDFLLLFICSSFVAVGLAAWNDFINSGAWMFSLAYYNSLLNSLAIAEEASRDEEVDLI